MYDWVQKLLAVQDKDLRIAKLEEQVKSVPAEKRNASTLLKDAQTGVAVARDKVTVDEKAIKSLEIDVQTVQTRMRDFQSKSAMIKSNDDYKSALLQIDACRQQIAQFEDRELVLMEDLERSRRALDAREKELAAAKTRVAEMVADLDTRTRNCTAQLTALQAERAAATEGIPATTLQRYDRVRNSRRSREEKRAFVPVRGGACDSCHMNITAQMRMNVRKGMPEPCQMCGVLLYEEE